MFLNRAVRFALTIEVDGELILPCADGYELPGIFAAPQQLLAQTARLFDHQGCTFFFPQLHGFARFVRWYIHKDHPRNHRSILLSISVASVFNYVKGSLRFLSRVTDRKKILRESHDAVRHAAMSMKNKRGTLSKSASFEIENSFVDPRLASWPVPQLTRY